MTKKIVYKLVIFSFLVGCKLNHEEESNFPNVKNITELESTDFSPTLESSFDIDKNSIYSASLVFAWNEIKSEIGETLNTFTSKQLEEINRSNSYQGVLSKKEYKTSIELVGKEIEARAYFRISLPFDKPLTKSETPIFFNNSKIESFGFSGGLSFAKINYYNSTNEFSISLFPKNKEHEIILIANPSEKKNFSTFEEYFRKYKKEKKMKRNKFFRFNDNDEVKIPIIEFNIEKFFDRIIGSTFNSSKMSYVISETYQRNAFILNENGTEVESEAKILVKEAAEESDKKKPKKMIFNKPFVVLLKKKSAENPYFGIYIANKELLKQMK